MDVLSNSHYELDIGMLNKLSGVWTSDQNLEAKSSNNQTITIFGIITETEATVPIDRSRKKIGVGEKAILSFEPTGLGSPSSMKI